MEKVMNKTIAGESIVQQLEKIHKKNIEEFKKTEESIKEEEALLLTQKNILSKEEYKKKVDILKTKVNNYKNNRKDKIDSVSNKKIQATSSFLEKINPILTDYSISNNISMILQKKNIVIAQSNLEITDEIIKIIDSKVKKIILD